MPTDRDEEDRAIWRLEACGLHAVGSPGSGYHVLDPFGGLVAVAPDLTVPRAPSRSSCAIAGEREQPSVP